MYTTDFAYRHHNRSKNFIILLIIIKTLRTTLFTGCKTVLQNFKEKLTKPHTFET